MTLTENKFEGLFIIGYGLGGGFGGQRNFKVIEANDEDEAFDYAYESASEEYESYSGMHGLRSVSQIMQEDEIEDEEEALEVYDEEKENWLDYSAKPYTKEYEKEVSNYHYHNDFKHITDK